MNTSHDRTVFLAMMNLLDELRMARTLGDVNLAAGKAWQDLAESELELSIMPVAVNPSLAEVFELPR